MKKLLLVFAIAILPVLASEALEKGRKKLIKFCHSLSIVAMQKLFL